MKHSEKDPIEGGRQSDAQTWRIFQQGCRGIAAETMMVIGWRKQKKKIEGLLSFFSSEGTKFWLKKLLLLYSILKENWN